MGAFLIGKQVWIFGSVLLIVGLIMLVKEEVVVIHVSRIVAIINSVKQKKKGSDLKSILFFKRFYYQLSLL